MFHIIIKDFKFLYNLLQKYYLTFLSLIVVFIIAIFSIFFLDSELKNILFKIVLAKVRDFPIENNFYLLMKIFFNNLLVLFLFFLLSFTYIYVYLVDFFNALVIAIVIEYSIKYKGLSLFEALVYLLPHGILELSAFFLASFLSLLWWTKLYSKDTINKEQSRKEFSLFVFRNFVYFMFLLFISAFIEVFITPLIISL